MPSDESEYSGACHVLDARNTLCPEPIMLLHQRLRDLHRGDTIHVYATDPSTQRDIPKLCHYLGHKLVNTEERNGYYCFTLQKYR